MYGKGRRYDATSAVSVAQRPRLRSGIVSEQVSRRAMVAGLLLLALALGVGGRHTL
ncbi:hypothetical protein [Nonomuraea turkmeniaca]|uniref:hypothetical protein n=1 Tax=Nonomuraea turkmeniaca TaxID=103838 RepID=UPI001476CE4D|nr:hypothetical protein [Nonomuraea turkmeniaca]